MSPRLATVLAPLLGLAACASAPQRFEDVNRSEGLLEVLPRDATIEVDGVQLGPGARVLPVTSASGVHRVVARAPGFDPLEVRVPAPLLAGGRVGLVLRPHGFGVGRRLQIDEPSGLTAAAALLLRGGREVQAAEYALRAAELAPEEPAPRRLLGDAFLRMGRRDRAVQEYSAYLTLAAREVPDRAEVERRVADLRGDMTVPRGDR